MMRGRCSTSSVTRCMRCSPTSPIPPSPAPACSRTGWSCPRNSTSTGWSVPRCSPASPCITRPASRCRRTCCAGCSRRAPSTRALPRWNTCPRRWYLELHLQPGADDLDIDDFEQKALARIGMPDEIVMRHRPTHFGHIFSGGGYASAYYSYMWSEVLDADAFSAFEETGDVFDARTAKSLHDHVYAAGGSRDPAELYTAFRGRLPTPDKLLKRRGLADGSAPA